MNKAKMKPVEIKVIPGGLKDKDLKHKYSVAIAEGRRVKDPGLKYHRARCVSLKKSNIKERWLGDEIVKDPSILDLGNVEVVERELAQKRKSLDLLLQNDTDNNLKVFITDRKKKKTLVEYFGKKLSINIKNISINKVLKIPRNRDGKILYSGLEKLKLN